MTRSLKYQYRQPRGNEAVVALARQQLLQLLRWGRQLWRSGHGSSRKWPYWSDFWRAAARMQQACCTGSSGFKSSGTARHPEEFAMAGPAKMAAWTMAWKAVEEAMHELEKKIGPRMCFLEAKLLRSGSELWGLGPLRLLGRIGGPR